jgi:predicted transcriptional regulator
MAAWPEIELVNDKRGDQFKVIVQRVQRKSGLPGVVIRQVPTSSDKSPIISQQELDVLISAKNEATRAALQKASGLSNRGHFTNSILKPLMERGLLEMVYPDKPRSSKQRYRLTEVGQEFLRGPIE